MKVCDFPGCSREAVDMLPYNLFPNTPPGRGLLQPVDICKYHLSQFEFRDSKGNKTDKPPW